MQEIPPCLGERPTRKAEADQEGDHVDVFELRDRLIADYSDFVGSFMHIRDERIANAVQAELDEGLLWPEPLIQLNPSFEPGETVDDLVGQGVLHPECSRAFLRDKTEAGEGNLLRLHRHQAEAIKIACGGHSYVLTTGTGSGKSLAYIIPIVDHVLRSGSGRGIQAIIVYPMNALANSQKGELEKFLCKGYPDGRGPATFARYTGQERDEERQAIIASPPDILLTNYVMLELLLTRPYERGLIEAARGLRFLVLDELHTYRGRQGADVGMLARRARDAFGAEHLQCVGTSATLAGEGDYEQQRAEVAQVTSQIFGSEVRPEHVIGETLRRTTPDCDLSDPGFVAKLRARIQGATDEPPTDHEGFVGDPLSAWLEGTFGVATERETGRLVRAKPRTISGEHGAARDLSELTGVAVDRCADTIKQQLMASYRCEPDPVTGFPVFAFRLHQFVSRGDTVYASLQPEDERYLTVHGQQFVPGDRRRRLFPLVFCRECGQEYYCVRKRTEEQGEGRAFEPRELSDPLSDEEGEAGFLYLSTKAPWPTDPDEVMERLPEDWLEEHRGVLRVRRGRRDALPEPVNAAPDGHESADAPVAHYIRTPFRFCLRCGISFDFRQKSDFAKLTSLSTEGRSSATTILSLSAVRYLQRDETLGSRARKLLSFTDNRQDASLQAGHFNDFVEVGLLRSGLYRAAHQAGSAGLRHDDLTQRVFDALELPLELYASDPTVRFQALGDTNRALRSVLGYRLYRDLKRGWRVTTPNLEQCGLLEIRYLSLDELCRAEDVWESCHPALAEAAPDARVSIARTILDFMRRELAIKVDYLEQRQQERIQQQSSQRLRPPWTIDENEKLETAAVLYPRSYTHGDFGGDVFLSPRSGFGQYLRRPGTFPELQGRLSLAETEAVIRQLLEALRIAGLVEVVRQPRDEDGVPGYQVLASSLLWVTSDGTRPFHDPIRVPRPSDTGGQTNPFFIQYYKSIAAEGKGLEAREHTAQVPYDERIRREDRFREADLPILYCSPTMELGVDIAELNAVNLRNVPPTPANYAQRSGRAGRSGQPALVFAYCSNFSSHDQYFFRAPEGMVAGAVKPPRVDLTNEDLIRAHVYALWLAETGLGLGSSLKDILDLSLEGDQPRLQLLDSVQDAINDDGARDRARTRAARVLESIQGELESTDWFSDGWLDEVLTQVALQFDRACDRWRSLYRAAFRQRATQHRIIADASRSTEEKGKAKRLRAEAEAQMELLTEAQNAFQGDFYSYRYFASEGFLPGYNFPRLPLSAYIPGRRAKGRDAFLSRPRFLAVSEFGPRAIVYHEGSRYRINKVILPVEDRQEGGDVVTTAVKQCGSCGYLHPSRESGPDLCERCGGRLDAPLRELFRLQNVSTKRADRINCDEEERLRLGYEIKTGYRFAERAGGLSARVARVAEGEEELARLTYGHAATLWRVNLGWRRRTQREQYGFMLDVERGYWSRNQRDFDDEDDPLSERKRRVIPYVEDRKNCLLVEPSSPLDLGTLASLQAALKMAIQVEFQLEEGELAAERLPTQDDARLLLLYEAAEGGAGVLRRLIDDPKACGRVARRALEICHFDPETGHDLGRAARSREDCEAACYDCLMSYANQLDHRILDRKRVRDLLMRLASAEVMSSPTPLPRAAHLERLRRQCQSGLERGWLDFLEQSNLSLPSRAQVFIQACGTRPDFVYDEVQTAVYVDGPHHEYPERQERDRTQDACMEDSGWTIIRFGHRDNWQPIIEQHPNIFGAGR